jgi:hypothetical protein
LQQELGVGIISRQEWNQDNPERSQGLCACRQGALQTLTVAASVKIWSDRKRRVYCAKIQNPQMPARLPV